MDEKNIENQLWSYFTELIIIFEFEITKLIFNLSIAYNM